MTATHNEAALFRRLEALKEHCRQLGCNQRDQVHALIPACIDEGIATGPEIIRALVQIGYDRNFVGIQLNKNIGHLWHRDGDRLYVPLPPLA